MNIKPFNQKLVQLTQLLNNSQPHSGSELGAKLHVTRSAIWKMMKKLEGYHIAIQPSQRDGYLLQEPLLLLDPDLIKNQLSYDVPVTVLESISSTNDYFKLTQPSLPDSPLPPKASLANAKKRDIVVPIATSPSPAEVRFCLAEEQTKGRGRHHRSWNSPFGKNIYLSCYYPIQKDMSELSGLSLVVGLAVRSMLRSCYSLNVSLKWPNDILCQGKKIAGILIDVQAESHSISVATIGIGLNVNVTTQEENAPSHFLWTSLREEKKALFDRNTVAAALIQSLTTYVKLFEKHGLSFFKEEWQESDPLIGKNILLHRSHDTVAGVALGINDQGHLLLQLSDQKIQAFSSGDVSLSSLKSA